MRPVNPSGAGLLPSAFASADNIAAQTATALHGLMFVWDSGGGNWDRWTGAVTGSGNFTVVQGTGTNLHIVCDSGCGGAASFADNAAFTFGTTAINISGGVLDDTGTAACTENSACAPRITAQKGLHANLRNNAGTEVGTSGAPLRTDPTGTTTQPVSGTVTVTDGAGALNVIVDSSALPSGASTLGEQQTQTTSLQLIDDAVNAANTALSKVLAQGCQFDDTTPGTVTENNISPVRCSTRREVYGQIRDAAGNERGANVNASNAVLTAQTGELPAGTQNIGDVDIASLPNEGQQTMANSVSVAIASDQSVISVSAVGTLTHDGAASSGNRVGTLPAIARSTYQGLTDGRNEALQVGSETGNLLVASMPDSSVASYSASAVVSSAASATDISVIPGNATNTVLVTELRVSCTQTTAGIIELHIIKRGSADSGGTSAGMTEVPDDANYAAASSALLTYTANPTINGTVGDVDIVKLGCMATGTTSPNDIYIGNWRQKPFVLRGTAQQLAVNLNSVTVTGGSFTITWKWMETTGP